MKRQTLVAGIGNVFFTDDGFGVEVAARLAREEAPDGVRVMDAGIRARHLAFELAGGTYNTAILVDTVKRGGAPGTVYLIEPELPPGSGRQVDPGFDGHAMDPAAMLAFLQTIGGSRTRILVVGCEPACVDEGMGLTPVVAAAVAEAVVLIRGLLSEPRELHDGVGSEAGITGEA